MTVYTYNLKTQDITKLDPDTQESVVIRQQHTIERTPSVTYPDTPTIDADISNNVPLSYIKQKHMMYLKGREEASIVATEELWYNTITSLFTLQDEIFLLNEEHTELLSNNEDTHNVDERLKTINGYTYTTYDGPRSSEVTHTITGELETITQQLTDLYDKHPYLKLYINEETDATRPVTQDNYILNDVDTKKLIVYSRDRDIRTAEDSIADIAKMVSLTFSVISSLWELVPDEDKDTIGEDKRNFIDYAVSKFDSIQTRADRQLVNEGTDLIDKLYDREVAIADMIDNIK